MHREQRQPKAEQKAFRSSCLLRSLAPWLGAMVLLGGAAVARANSTDAADWTMYNYDAAGTRDNTAEHTLAPGNVSGLHVYWQYPTPAPVSGTPIVVDGNVYAGDMAGNFYALGGDGSLLWSFTADASITASAAVKNNVVVFGDTSGKLYGLSRNNGKLKWSMRPDPHPLAAIWGSPTPVGPNMAVGVASNEEAAAADLTYPCCSTRGSMVLLNPENGHIIWQTFTITDQERAAGASGSSIWSTPTYDPGRNLIYATTGNNFSQPTNGTSDAIMAFDAGSGAVRWVTQLNPNDEWNFRFPYSAEHPDADFGDSAQVYTLPDGHLVVGAGQKSGFYHVLDAASGALVHQDQYQVGGSLGGLFADSAVAGGVVFANGVDWPTPGAGAPNSGALIAISGDGAHELWRFTTPYSPDFSGVAVANGVVYFTSWGFPVVGGLQGYLYALDAASGATLAQVELGEASETFKPTSTSGPAISRGMVYVGTGDAIAAGFNLGVGPGTITALGL